MKQAAHIVGLLFLVCLAAITVVEWGFGNDQGEPRKRLFRKIPNNLNGENTGHKVVTETEVAAPITLQQPQPAEVEERLPAPPKPEVELLPSPVGMTRDQYQQQLKDFETHKALGIAQTYYKRSLWESAAEWYLNALESDPNNKVAAEGFVMSAFSAGKYRHAYKVAGELSNSIPGVKDTVLQAANEEVRLLITEKRLDTASDLLAEFPASEAGLAKTREILELVKSDPNYRLASKTASPDPTTKHNDLATNPTTKRHTSYPYGAELIRGWSQFHLGKYDEAARVFERLYQTQTNREAARGIIASLRADGDIARLERLVNDWGGILAEEYTISPTTAPTTKPKPKTPNQPQHQIKRASTITTPGGPTPAVVYLY